jgi:hypothetical protein
LVISLRSIASVAMRDVVEIALIAEKVVDDASWPGGRQALHDSSRRLGITQFWFAVDLAPPRASVR